MWSVFFVFLSYLDRNFVKGEFLSQALDAEKESKELFYMLNNTLCAKSSVVGQHHLHQVTDGAEEIRSVHDSEGRLVDCSVIQNEMQVKSFMHVCKLGLRNQMSSDLKMSLTGVSEAKANCDKLKSKGDRNVITTTKQAKEPNSDVANNKKTRTKRGFTYPGTLWCGAGNIADHYDQLGEFEETDKCCRVHDHCPYVIHAFSSNYGYTNFKWHSLSHCDCDNALKECLRLVNDTSSRVVGQAFFNVIEVPCFEFSFEEQCVERHWYGVCKKYDRVPVAVIKESIPYDFGGVDVIDVLTIAPPKKKQSDEEKQNTTTSESTTQSSFSESKTAAPEEPSLTNVVTAAEDFIKVLATVSTSQSSSTDTGKGETQTSEKKRKKNSSKKKKENKKKRGKGKGRKKNKKLGAVLKVDEGTTGAPSTSQTEEVMGKNNFAEEAAKMNQFRIKENNFMNIELDSEGNSNKMMRDDPQRTVNDNQDVVTITTSIKTDKEPETLEHRQANHTELVSTSPTAHITPAVRDKTRAKLRQRAGKKNQRKNNPSTEAKEETLSTSPSEGVSLVTSKPERPAAAVRNEVMQSTIHTEEKGPVVTTTQKTPIVRTKRPSSRQREGRKRMRKIIASSTEEPPRDNRSQEPLLFTGSATVSPTDVLERLGLDRLENPTESLKDTNGRKKKGRRVIKICYEAILPDVADTTPLPTLIEKDTEFQLKDPEMNTAPMFPLLQTNTASTATRRNTKMKRSRERGNREKRGKVKRE
uniref:phospholipase A2 n=1 Tax=Cyprinus carpio TaxID=7962 RepID=A0A4D6T3I7_CYPCA|nr:group III secreted phospholipase A2-C1 [Cyprinus carpio]